MNANPSEASKIKGVHVVPQRTKIVGKLVGVSDLFLSIFVNLTISLKTRYWIIAACSEIIVIIKVFVEFTQRVFTLRFIIKK